MRNVPVIGDIMLDIGETWYCDEVGDEKGACNRVRLWWNRVSRRAWGSVLVKHTIVMRQGVSIGETDYRDKVGDQYL